MSDTQDQEQQQDTDQDQSDDEEPQSRRTHPQASTPAPADMDMDEESLSDQGRAYLTALAVANGNEPPKDGDLDDRTLTAVGERLTGNAAQPATAPGAMGSPGGSRPGIGSPGYSHGEKRDVWDVLGYPETGEVEVDDYISRARRQDPANIICNKPVETSWKLAPKITDAARENEADDKTEFETDITTLLNADNDLKSGLLHYLEWADREQRPGQYGLLFIGLDDGAEKSEPVNIDEINGPEDIKYLRPFNQDNVESWNLAGDLNESEQKEHIPPWAEESGDDEYFLRPDMPVDYDVTFTGVEADGSEGDGESETIHWTRVVHIAETPTSSEFIGQSCLEPILNRLMDYEKVMGASAEMYWTGADRKFFLSAEGDRNMVTDEDIQWLDAQFQAMMHNKRNTLYTQNMDFETVGGQAVDPSGILDKLYSAMAGVSGLPKRMMTGSERGDLASSMDQANWFGRIHERQEQFCEPSILRPIIDRFIVYGAISEPEGLEETEVDEPGDYATYVVDWPSLFELTEQEKAKLGLTKAQTLKELENAIALGSPRDMAYSEAGYEYPDEMLDEDGWAEYDTVDEPDEGDGVDRGSVPDADRSDPEEATGDPGDGGSPSGDPGGREDEDEAERDDEQNRHPVQAISTPDEWSAHDEMARVPTYQWDRTTHGRDEDAEAEADD